jgi:hypothetical protein
MRSARLATIAISIALVVLALTIGTGAARQPESTAVPELVAAYHFVEPAAERSRPGDQGGGIRENIPAKYQARYQEWKREFLASEAGKEQWAYYQNNPNFLLRIEISRQNAEGATTGSYEWGSSGKLVAATITLGIRLDEGYPNPIYFPVMNSLGPSDSAARIAGVTLAATKLAHEFGHVNRTAKVDPALYQLQGQLIPEYNKIFLNNGRNANDPRLVEMVNRIGGTPVEIWEDREYWGEANAMAFLRDRFSEDGLRCSLFSKIKQSVDLYARNYEGRFLEIAQATPSHKMCGWR